MDGRAAAAGATAKVPTRPEVQLVKILGELNTGRPVTIELPVDVTDAEVLSLIDGVLRIRDAFAAQRVPAPPGTPRLYVPS